MNLARFLKIDPEIAMKKASGKFSRRFREMERRAREQGTTLAEVLRGRMEELWEEAKKRGEEGR
jgi:tetrapyrrole methylase family protein/MazG family protein